MSIGETLTQARRRAGLTVTEVSQRTRIRETLVRDIEHDDYSACGGDFYTRGHIRAIARVVGTDPEPLIAEYDTAQREPSGEYGSDWRELLVERGPPGLEQTVEHGSLWRELAAEQGSSPGALSGDHRARRGEPPAKYDPSGPEPALDHGPLWQQPVEHLAPWREPPTDDDALDREAVAGQASVTGPAASSSEEAVPFRMRGRRPIRTGGPLPFRTHRRRLRNAPLLVGVALVVVLGFLGYYFVAGTSRAPASAPAAGNHTAGSGAGRASPSGQAASPAHTVVVHLTAIRDTSVVFTTPHGDYLFRSNIAAGASKRWTFRQPVHMRLANPGGVKLAVDGKNPLPAGSAVQPITLSLSPGHPARVTAPASAPTPAATTTPAAPIASGPLTPASAAAFGPSGGQGDNPTQAHLAIDGKRSTSWNTDWYASARFGNLYPATGLLLDMGRAVTITGAQITLGRSAGASFELRVGSAHTPDALSPVAHASGASGVVRLQPTTPVRGRYLLIWFTKLPPGSAGNFEASVYDVRLEGRK